MIIIPDVHSFMINLSASLQLGTEICGIQLAGQIGRSEIHPGIFIHLAAEKLTSVSPLFPEDFCLFQVFIFLKQKSTALAHGIILGLMETEAAKITECSQSFPLIIGVDPLGGIFNDFQSIPFSNIQNCVHLTGHACVMYRNYSPCLVCNGVLDQTFIYIHGFRMHIYKHNPCPSKDKCIGSRDKCIGWHNHLVSGLNICQI